MRVLGELIGIAEGGGGKVRGEGDKTSSAPPRSRYSRCCRCYRRLSGFADFLNILEEFARHKLKNM